MLASLPLFFSTHALYIVVGFFAENWRADKEKTGKQKTTNNPKTGSASEGLDTGDDSEGEDEEINLDSDDDGGIDDMNRKTSSKSSNADSTMDDDGGLDDVTERIKQRLKLSNYHNYVKSDLFPYTVIVWTDPDTTQQYVEIAIEVYGSMIASDFVAKIIKDGTAVQVSFHFPDGGALLSPFRLLDQHDSCNFFDAYHVKYQQYDQAYRFHQREIDQDVRLMEIKLPFKCDTTYFIDPFAENPLEGGIVLGSFPIPDRGADDPMTAPPASTKIFILGLEDAEKPMVKQVPKAKDFTRVSITGLCSRPTFQTSTSPSRCCWSGSCGEQWFIK